MKNILQLIVFSFCLQLIILPQQRITLKPDKELNQKINSILKANFKYHLKNKDEGKNIDEKFNRNISFIDGITDTLTYNDGSFNTSFLINGQEWLMQWYRAPADLIIKQVGFYCTLNQRNDEAEFKIVKVEWSEDSLHAILDNIGYYPALGNGCHDITALYDDATGPWISQNGYSEPFGQDIWSDGGNLFPFVPTPNTGYQWIPLNILFEPEISAGEIFGIVVKNNAICDSGQIGFLAGQGGPPSWKFYSNGRINPGVDIGWWIIDLTLDFPVVVDIISDPLIPLFEDYTTLTTTTSSDPRPVSAIVTLGGQGVPEIIVNVPVVYSSDNGMTWQTYPAIWLDHISYSLYTGELPGFPAGTLVSYNYVATDTIRMYSTETPIIGYRIFGSSGANTLVVLNGYYQTDGYPQDYFFGPDIQSGNSTFAHDTWAYGPLTSDLLNNYDNLIEICNGAPDDYNDSIVRPWLAANGNRNYYLEGQEWLGQRYNYVDTNFVAGDFEFDILGINASFNDVNYNGTSGQTLPSKLTPQAGTLFGQPLIDRFNTYFPVPDSIQYNPMYVGQFGDVNWIDGFNVESDVVVDVLTETRGINGIPNVQNLPCAIHRTLPNGNKIFFASYWTYAVNTATNINMPTYHWLGFTNESPAYQALLWFGIPIITNIENKQNSLPTKFSLDQNYPNPFNPSTSIQYAISSRQLVTLKVYDILGSEVANLVNEELNAGSYKVEFNSASSIKDLASGIYFYQLKAGSFVVTKKMVLIK